MLPGFGGTVEYARRFKWARRIVKNDASNGNAFCLALRAALSAWC
jgi:hypothetical protein